MNRDGACHGPFYPRTAAAEALCLQWLEDFDKKCGKNLASVYKKAYY